MKKIYLFLIVGICIVSLVYAGVSINNSRVKDIDIDKNSEEISYEVNCECLSVKGDICNEFGKCFVTMNINGQNVQAGYFIGQYDIWKLNELYKDKPTPYPVIEGDVS